jgi:hypothetical protein
VPSSPTRKRFEDVCGQIGVGLAEMGFRYLKSKRQAKKVAGGWTQVVSFQSSVLNTTELVRLWVWYRIDSNVVRRWRQECGAAGNSARVFGCGLGYLGNPATFVQWNVAGDSAAVVRDVVDRVRSGADRISSVIMDVPTFLDQVSDSDLTFFNPGDVVDLLAAHGCNDGIGSYLRRLSGGLQSTGTVGTDGPAILAAVQRHLAGEAETSHTIAADLVDALSRAGSSHLLAEALLGSGQSRRRGRLFGQR